MRANSHTLAKYTLKAMRLIRMMASSTLAEALDVSPAYLSTLENGRRPISSKIMRNAARVFQEPLMLSDPELKRISELIKEDPKVLMIAAAYVESEIHEGHIYGGKHANNK